MNWFAGEHFDDADPEPMPKMLTCDTWQQAKTAIRNWVKAAVNGGDL